MAQGVHSALTYAFLALRMSSSNPSAPAPPGPSGTCQGPEQGRERNPTSQTYCNQQSMHPLFLQARSCKADPPEPKPKPKEPSTSPGQ